MDARCGHCALWRFKKPPNGRTDYGGMFGLPKGCSHHPGEKIGKCTNTVNGIKWSQFEHKCIYFMSKRTKKLLDEREARRIATGWHQNPETMTVYDHYLAEKQERIDQANKDLQYLTSSWAPDPPKQNNPVNRLRGRKAAPLRQLRATQT